MDLGGEASGGLEMGDNWGGGGVLNDQAIWATEDEYRNWNATMSMSNSNYNTSGPPPNKKTRSSQSQSQSQSQSGDSRSKAIGKMFYKTKLCCKYRAGVCPYITNCNFAHGLEELRKPPPNWQDIVAAHEETVEQREEHQIPTITTTDSRNESQRSYKGRHCKKFYTEEGCPYGDTCTFLHDEQSRARESVAISVSPSLGPPSSAPCHKPSNWKTRICNKWETTGTCPFGTKCHFAHGFTELHKYGGGLMDGEGGRDSSVPAETKQASMPIKTADTSLATSLTAPRPDFHQVGLGIPSQRPSSVAQVVGQRPLQKWKGPDKISRIYGDWIDDFE